MTGWWLAAALALASLATSVRAAEPVVVADVKVEGNRRVEADTIRATVTKKGARYDPRRVEADVRALMKLGFFSDVVVEVEGDEPIARCWSSRSPSDPRSRRPPSSATTSSPRTTSRTPWR